MTLIYEPDLDILKSTSKPRMNILGPKAICLCQGFQKLEHDRHKVWYVFMILDHHVYLICPSTTSFYKHKEMGVSREIASLSAYEF